MKSRISFFDATLFKKDVTRFAPLWALYTVGVLLVFFASGDTFGGYADFLGDSIRDFAIVNLIYAAIAAQLLFGDLFRTRLCNALHAMPMRREARFFTHVTAGLAFSLVPNLLVTLLSMALLGEFWFIAPIWLLGVTLSYVTFFGIAVFSMFCTGSRFAMAAVYGILNFAAWVAYWFADAVYRPLLWGVTLDETIFAWFSPVYTIASDHFVNLNSYYSQLLECRVYEFLGWGDGWLYLSLAAVVGILLTGCALVLYRRRALESAGDFMAVRWLRPVFLTVYTLCAGAFLAMFGDSLSGGYLIFLVIGVVCGFFTGLMLLDRTIRVFRKKRFLYLFLLLVALGLSLVVAKTDLLGVVRWLPEADKVESVVLEGGGEEILLEEQWEIETVLTAHEAFIRGNDEDPGQYVNIYFTYTMKSGRVVKRHYPVLLSTPELKPLEREFFSAPEAVFGFTGSWESYKQSVQYISYTADNGQPVKIYDEAQISALLDALYLDCEAGNMAQSWAFHEDAGSSKYVRELILYTDMTAGMRTRYLNLYSNAKNTLFVLSTLPQGEK